MDLRYTLSKLLERRIPRRQKLESLKKSDLKNWSEKYDMPTSGKKKSVLVEQLLEERELQGQLRGMFIAGVILSIFLLYCIYFSYTLSENILVKEYILYIFYFGLVWIAWAENFKNLLYRGTFRSRPGDSYRLKIQNIDSFISKNTSHETLTDFIEKKYSGERFNGYSLKKSWFFSNLIDDNLSSTERNFLSKRLRRVSPFLRNNRNNQEYALDLLLGWLMEDWFCDYVAEHHPDVSAQLVGIDKIRDISISANSTADVELTFDEAGASIRVDIFADFLGHSSKNGSLDLKEGKIKSLQRGDLDFVVGIAITTGEYYLFGHETVQEASDSEINTGYSVAASNVMTGDAMNIQTLMHSIKNSLDTTAEE